jgi:hypothetical protein
MLWNMAEVDGAIHLLREMSIPDSRRSKGTAGSGGSH